MATPGVTPRPNTGGGSATGGKDGLTVRQRPPGYKLVILAGPKAGSEFPIEHDEFTVGRASDNLVCVPDVSISRRHAQFTRTADGFTVTDLKSGNGTKVNGVATQSALVRHGDEVSLGDTVIQVIDFSKQLVAGMMPINKLKAPSGDTTTSQVITDFDRAKVPARAHAPPPTKTPAAPMPAKPSAPPAPQAKRTLEEAMTIPPQMEMRAERARKQSAAKNKRFRMYLFAALMIMGFLIAMALLKSQSPAPAPAPRPAAAH